MNRSEYDGEILRQLSDSKTYLLIEDNHLQFRERIKTVHDDLLKVFKKAFDSKILLDTPSVEAKKVVRFIEYKITGDSAKLPEFYILPKVHKATFTGRPIVPSHSSITTAASIWLDHILQPHVKNIPTLILDSTSLINKLKQLRIYHPNCIFITMDVISLYTNIPIGLCIQLVKQFLTETKAFTPEQITFIIQVLEIVLRNNYFTALGKIYLQLIGTAMGTSVAPAIANIFMFMLERKIVQRLRHLLPYYGRFLDDILAIAENQITADQLVKDLNNMHTAIKLETTQSASSANFLDLHIFKDSTFHNTGILQTKVHQKQLNAYLYIPFNSFHSPKAKGAFIKTELLRYVRTCSRWQDYIEIKQLFFDRLRARGYKASFLEYYFRSVSYQDRNKILARQRVTTNVVTKDSASSEVFFSCPYDTKTSKLPLLRILNCYRKGDSYCASIPRTSYRSHNNLLNTLKYIKPISSTNMEQSALNTRA